MGELQLSMQKRAVAAWCNKNQGNLAFDTSLSGVST